MFINIKDARKHYGEGETLVNALDGVSLSLNEGRIYIKCQDRMYKKYYIKMYS